MRNREDLQARLYSSNDTEFSLEVIGEMLSDIRELLQQLQPPTIITTLEDKPNAN